MIRIAICDDEIKEIDNTHSMITKYMKKNSHYEITIHSFFSPLELLSYISIHGVFDITILDIYMDGMLGTEVAKELHSFGEVGEIIFITNSRDHAIDAFELEATQYLIKPYAKDAFFRALDKILKRSYIERRNAISLKTTKGVIKVFSRDIIYTETGRNNYQIIHTISGDRFEVRMTSTELFQLLQPTNSFTKCGAAININLKFVRQILKDKIIFDSGKELPYPYRSYNKVKNDFLAFQMSGEN